MDVAPTTLPAPATTPVPPSHALLREFSDLRSSLERFDASFTSWQQHGRTFPSRELSGQVSELALRFDTARTALATYRPEARDLNARLQRDSLFISKVAGQLDVMNQHRTTFGGGWSRSFDQPILDTVAAIDLLAGAPARP